MNEFRSRLFGAAEAKPVLVGTKAPRGASGDSGLGSVAVPRHETRTSDSRDCDRHRLAGEQVRAVHDSTDHQVELINLSGGGAMISRDFAPNLWDRVDLHLGDNGRVECAVRWIKGGRIGLEFAHETQLDCSPETRATLLRDVLARSFPDATPDSVTPPPGTEDTHDRGSGDGVHRRGHSRHPLIWSGQIYFNHDSLPVRLRNISATGAMIECGLPLPVGATMLLDLGEAGSPFATVTWAAGDQAGLSFQLPYDLTQLSRSKPEVAPAKWQRPDYLGQGTASDSPWAEQWDRMSLSDLRADLEGFLKH